MPTFAIPSGGFKVRFNGEDFNAPSLAALVQQVTEYLDRMNLPFPKEGVFGALCSILQIPAPSTPIQHNASMTAQYTTIAQNIDAFDSDSLGIEARDTTPCHSCPHALPLPANDPNAVLALRLTSIKMGEVNPTALACSKGLLTVDIIASHVDPKGLVHGVTADLPSNCPMR